MKKLQNNFTTPEQSKRLLELGVSADSADCYLLRTHTKGDTFTVEVLHDELYSKKDKFTNMLEYLPCWSAGRLIEILMVCGTYFAPKEFRIEPNSMKPTLIENIINKIEELEGYDMFDISKLEE